MLLSAVGDLWLKGALITYQAPGAVESSLTYHRHILGQVRKRNPEKSRQAMRDHVRQSQALLEVVRQQGDTL